MALNRVVQADDYKSPVLFHMIFIPSAIQVEVVQRQTKNSSGGVWRNKIELHLYESSIALALTYCAVVKLLQSMRTFGYTNIYIFHFIYLFIYLFLTFIAQYKHRTL